MGCAPPTNPSARCTITQAASLFWKFHVGEHVDLNPTVSGVEYIYLLRCAVLLNSPYSLSPSKASLHVFYISDHLLNPFYLLQVMESSYTSFPAFKPTRRPSLAQSVKNSFSATLPTYLVPAQSTSSQPSIQPRSSHRHNQSR